MMLCPLLALSGHALYCKCRLSRIKRTSAMKVVKVSGLAEITARQRGVLSPKSWITAINASGPTFTVPANG